MTLIRDTNVLTSENVHTLNLNSETFSNKVDRKSTVYKSFTGAVERVYQARDNNVCSLCLLVMLRQGVLEENWLKAEQKIYIKIRSSILAKRTCQTVCANLKKRFVELKISLFNFEFLFTFYRYHQTHTLSWIHWPSAILLMCNIFTRSLIFYYFGNLTV